MGKVNARDEAGYVAILIPAQRKVPPLRGRAADVTQSSAGPAARLKCGLGPHVPSVPAGPGRRLLQTSGHSSGRAAPAP